MKLCRILLLVLVALSTRPTDAAESEPNNMRQAANPLTVDSGGVATNIGRINPLSDLDFFRVTTPPFAGQRPLTVTMTPTAADRGLDAWIQLQNASGMLLAEADDGFDNTAESITYAQATGNTTYFIVCRSADFIDAGAGDYALEVHLMLDDDPNDQIAGALALGEVRRTLIMPGGIDMPMDVDIFWFTVAAGQRVSFDIDQTSTLDSHLRLFSADGTELAANNDAPGPGEPPGNSSYLEYTFISGGTFYLGVSGFGNTNYNALTGSGDVAGSSGSYVLVASPGLAGFIRRPGDTTDYLVDLLRFETNPPAINTNQRTWIVVHGWNSSRTNQNIFEVASALFQTRVGDQVMTLDWSDAANTLSPFAAEDSIVPVAQWAAAALIRHGFNGTNLNLVGHSFGSYVSDETAERIPGGVNTIVTLDPAADVLGGYDPDANNEVNFARDSFFSWSFHSSSLGNEYTPITADEAFIVDSSADAIDAHGNVVFLFAYMLLHPTELVSQYFLITFLLDGILGPWLPDQFESEFAADQPVKGYEAVIDTTDNGKVPVSLTYVPLPSISITKDGTNVLVAWHAFYTNFVLQTSIAIEQQPASWTNESRQPVLIGTSNVVDFPASEAKRFFRLKSF